MNLHPFVLTTPHNLRHLRHLDLFPNIAIMLVNDPRARDFALLLNHTNHLAFGGDGKNMGMPLWVMLDCGILSSAIIGFCTPTAELPDSLARTIGVTRDYGHSLAPLSEYCACPTLAPGCVSGFSLQSQYPGLGTRTKAMALLMYGATSQVGVTQFDNPSVRVHTKFGPLKLTTHRPVVHTHAEKSFTYELTLPHEDALLKMARGELQAHCPEDPLAGKAWAFKPAREADHAKLSDLLAQGTTVHIDQPGWRRALSGEVVIDLVVED